MALLANGMPAAADPAAAAAAADAGSPAGGGLQKAGTTSASVVRQKISKEGAGFGQEVDEEEEEDGERVGEDFGYFLAVVSDYWRVRLVFLVSFLCSFCFLVSLLDFLAPFSSLSLPSSFLT